MQTIFDAQKFHLLRPYNDICEKCPNIVSFDPKEKLKAEWRKTYIVDAPVLSKP